LKITLTFESNKNVDLPISYNHALQSLIYKVISEKLSDLHESGFLYNSRQFRPFVFSRIKGKHTLYDGLISFQPPISFSIASPVDEITQVIANEFLKSEELDVCGQRLKLVQLDVSKQEVKRSPVRVVTLSPITIRSTLTTAEGKKKSYYYNPFEKEFEAQIRENLLRKAKAIDQKLSGNEFSIKPITKMKQRIIRYKRFIVIAWDGKFELSGDVALIELALNWGLGSKNAQGFGMIDLTEGR